MNATIETILSRRTAHAYDSRAVPEDVLEVALRCAVRAPNHKLTNPWRFTRVGPATRMQLTEIALQLKREKGPISDAQLESVRTKVSSSPELFVVRQVLDEDDLRRKEDYAACACAIQNLALALWSEGVSSKWSSGAPTRDPRTYDLLGIDRAREEIVGFVFVGYAGPQPETGRAAVESVLDRLP